MFVGWKLGAAGSSHPKLSLPLLYVLISLIVVLYFKMEQICEYFGGLADGFVLLVELPSRLAAVVHNDENLTLYTVAIKP